MSYLSDSIKRNWNGDEVIRGREKWNQFPATASESNIVTSVTNVNHDWSQRNFNFTLGIFP